MSTTAGALLANDYLVPEEDVVRGARKRETYEELVQRLSHQSVVKHFEAYVDIPWDDPEYRIDHDDPRWELSEDDVLGRTAWYRAQPAGVRSRIGLHMFAAFMKIGLEFEGVLKRGLLEYAATLPNGSPEFRYVYHEVIEEAHHAMMFQEFVNRAGLPVRGLAWWQQFGARQVLRFARRFPEMFFVFVLGGEDPIDHVQRMALRNKENMPPIIRRIMQIHVTEEARHLCFARHYLRRHVADLSPFRRFVMARRAPVLLAIMSQMMMRPSGDVVRTYGIPKAVLKEAYGSRVHRERTVEALQKVRELLDDLGLVSPGSRRIWKRLGLWSPAAPAAG